MKEALDELKLPYTEAEDEAAFYGPKLDVQARNVNGKEDTLFTAQMDFLLPEKFNIEYTDSDGSKKRPVMIHRSTIGALERTFAFLIEHYAGAFPIWLAPVQIAIIPISSEKHLDYANQIAKQFENYGLRFKIYDQNDSLGKKIREAEMQKIPYLLIIGDKEMEAQTVGVRMRGQGDLGALSVEKFIEKINLEIKDKK